MLNDVLLTGPEQTRRAGLLLAPHLQAGDVIGLIGNLGAGKTLFTQGMAQGLELPEEVRVTSPTFALINEYKGARLPIVHMDLYRIEEERELEHLGLEDLLESGAVCSVEWCERFDVMPYDHLLLRIEIVDDGHRRLSAEAFGPRSEKLLAAWSEELPAKLAEKS